ncbi:MAG: iron-sulfur cluster assembly protein CyaY [Rhodospirillaceae bacterium]|jgi:frataxin|nr:iron-sulfur cluster assembly protein CyaY [Rhodospirillaceae bacterium]
MNSSQFDSIADAALERLQLAVETAAGDSVEVDLIGGILTLELDSGAKYLINKHGPNRQIWLASPLSGAWHFGWNDADQAWIATRGGERLEELLGRELSQACGKAIEIG